VTCCNRGWKPPIALCTVCDRERPCYHARTDHAICQSCFARSHREPCAFCGKTGRVAARTARGAQCPPCRAQALSTMVRCTRCERVARRALDDPSVCVGCAGEPLGPSCRTCGAADRENYADHRCGRCVLAERLDRLAAGGDPGAVAQLRPYLTALRDGSQPWSVLNWMTVSRGYDMLRELVTGTIVLSHKALDDLDRGQSTRYLRSALVRHGALPSRNDADALTGWIAREIARLPESEDRTHLRAFATWQVQHDLQRRAQRGQAKRSSHRLARTHIRVAAALIWWLHARDLTLRDLRQEHVDAWPAEGASTRRRLRAFVSWARRGGIVGELHVPALTDRGPGDPLDDDRRLGIIRRLLADAEIDLRDRVAGCLVLVFAQPISRLVLLRTDAVATVGATVTIRFGSESAEIPEPLGALVLELKAQPCGLATTAVIGQTEWLFPGLMVGSALSSERMRLRLAALGIRGRAGRGSALLRLARELPAPILADLLGIAESTADDWVRAAGGDWARYAAEASARK